MSSISTPPPGGPPPVGGPPPSGPASPPSGGSGPDMTISTLTKSLLEEFIKNPTAAIPFLIPPGMNAVEFFQVLAGAAGSDGNAIGGVAGSYALQIQQTYADIVNSMLDQWIRSIQDQAKRQDEEALRKVTTGAAENTAKGGTDYENWLKSQPAQKRADIIEMSHTSRFQVWFLEGIQSYVSNAASASGTDPSISVGQVTSNPLAYSSSNNNMLPLLAGSLIVGDTLSTNPIGLTDASSAKRIAANPYQDAFSFVSPAVGLSADYTAAGAMIAALFGKGVVYSSAGDTLDKAVSQNTPLHDANFAKDYAESIVGLVNGPGFNNFVMALLTQKIANTQPLTPEQQNDLLGTIKTILLTVALVVLYKAVHGGGQKAESGSMTGEEFLNIVDGQVDFSDDKEYGPTFASLIRAINASLPQDATKADSLLSALANYINSKPKVDDLLDIGTVFGGVNDQIDIEYRRAEEASR